MEKLAPKLDCYFTWSSEVEGKVWHFMSQEQLRKEAEQKYLLIQVWIMLVQVALWSLITVDMLSCVSITGHLNVASVLSEE